MNTLELMALNELQRELNNALEMRVLSNNEKEIITHETLVNRIKSNIKNALVIISAIRENNEQKK